MAEEKIIFVKEAKNKIIQYSKAITGILLAMGATVWVLGVAGYCKGTVTFQELADYTLNLSATVLPYFCLAASDRIQYAAEAIAKIFKKSEEN